MAKTRSSRGISALLIVTLFLPGCASYGGAGLVGAALGAGAGALIGKQSGHAGRGALIGAAVGGLTAVAVHDIVARKTKDAETTMAEYNYTPAQGEMMTFELARVEPGVIRRGSMAEASFQYVLLGTGTGVPVTETRTLLRNGETIAQLSSKTYTRNDGTWVSTQPFRVSDGLETGEYTLYQTAKTAKSEISGSTKFIVQ